jgi:hypothetical protein
MPAQTGVDQRERDDLALGAATGDGVVLDPERTFLVDCPSDARERVELWLCQPERNFTSDLGLEGQRLAITETLRQPCQNPLCREIKDRFESVCVGVHLVLGVVL